MLYCSALRCAPTKPPGGGGGPPPGGLIIGLTVGATGTVGAFGVIRDLPPGGAGGGRPPLTIVGPISGRMDIVKGGPPGAGPVPEASGGGG